MCEISDKLKLCTCNKGVSKLKYTWEYYRYVGNKGFYIEGEIMMPVDLEPELEAHNRELLTRLLNDGNVFDFEVTPKFRDRLVLHFDLSHEKEDEKFLVYEFLFVKGHWKFSEAGPFFIEENMKQIAHGKIENGLV